jgi:hypothetical protein
VLGRKGRASTKSHKVDGSPEGWEWRSVRESEQINRAVVGGDEWAAEERLRVGSVRQSSPSMTVCMP